MPPDPAHGTRRTYLTGCRCDQCAAIIPHGTVNGYHNYHCRCGACRTAHTHYLRAWRKRNTPDCVRGLGWPA